MKKITLIAMFAALLAGCGQAKRNDAAEVSQDKYNSVVYELNIRQGKARSPRPSVICPN